MLSSSKTLQRRIKGEAKAAKLRADIPLPAGATIYLIDAVGSPFAGSHASYHDLNGLPASDIGLFVHTIRPLKNGWRVAVVAPRGGLVQSFDQAAIPILFIAGAAFLVLFGSLSFALVHLASRSNRLWRTSGFGSTQTPMML